MLERVGQWCSGARHTAVCKSLSNLHPGFLLELSDKSWSHQHQRRTAKEQTVKIKNAHFEQQCHSDPTCLAAADDKEHKVFEQIDVAFATNGLAENISQTDVQI